jgi:hypothetical protein
MYPQIPSEKRHEYISNAKFANRIPVVIEHESLLDSTRNCIPSVYILPIPKVVWMLLDIPLVLLYNTIDDR